MKFGSKNRPRSWLDQDITNLRLSILILGQNFSSSKKSVLNDRRYDLPVEIGRKIRNLFCAGITVGAMWIRNGICAIQMWCWLFCCWLHYRKNRCSFPLFKDGQKKSSWISVSLLYGFSSVESEIWEIFVSAPHVKCLPWFYFLRGIG